MQDLKPGQHQQILKNKTKTTILSSSGDIDVLQLSTFQSEVFLGIF